MVEEYISANDRDNSEVKKRMDLDTFPCFQVVFKNLILEAYHDSGVVLGVSA